MKTDYELNNKTYKTLEAYTKGNCTQQMPYPDTWYYFATTIQFKSCKSFKQYLELKHKGHKFLVNIKKGV